MKITNGKYFTLIGIIHTLFGISPIAFGKQFAVFSKQYFFNISGGLLELPVLNGQPNFENFAAFWFFYIGVFLIPLGILLNFVENNHMEIPQQFKWSYFIAVAIGVYMIPLSGMTIFMLPHAVYMLLKTRKNF